MNRSFLIGCCLISVGHCLQSSSSGQTPAPRTLPFRISRETTYITEPLTATGLVDYVAWLNREMARGVTPETNAAVLFWKAVGKNKEFPQNPEIAERLIRGLGTDPFADEGPTLIGLDRIARAAGVEVDYGEGSEMGKQYNLAMERPWKPHEAPLVYKWLIVNKEPLETVLQGTKLPHYYHPLFGTAEDEMMYRLVLPNIQLLRELARMLSARSLLALGEHRPEDAMRDLLAIHRLARHSARGSTLINVLAGIALDSIANEGDIQLANSEAVTTSQLVQYAKQLSELSLLGDLRRSYQFERFAALDLIQRLASRQFPGEEDDDDPTGLLPLFELETDSEVTNRLMLLVIQHGVDWNQVLSGINEHYDRIQVILNQEQYLKRFQAFRDLVKDLDEGSRAVRSRRTQIASLFATPQQRADLLTAMLLNEISTAMVQADEATNRGKTKLVLSQIGVALAAYQKANGQFPASLEALIPDYLPELPNDPYTGKACIYRIDKQGAIVYSLGQNLKDDGGKSMTDDWENHDHAFRVKSLRAE